MSTRSITHIHESKSNGERIICSFYRHYDGYPSGHGADLIAWLSDKSIINHRPPEEKKNVVFNGCGDMAVVLMSHIRELSGCRVIPTGDSGYWEDYTYHVYHRDGLFEVECFDSDGKGVEL